MLKVKNHFQNICMATCCMHVYCAFSVTKTIYSDDVYKCLCVVATVCVLASV